MSGIAGIFRRLSNIETGLLDSMIETMAHRGPDGRELWTEHGIALASCLLKTTPESETETPVTSCEENRFKLVWDGRIDNREDFLEQFPQLANEPDSVLFIQTYKTWGKDCLKHLVGEFAFALWDRKEKTFFAGRDRVGLKPFNYVWDGQNFYFSSEIKPLFKALSGTPSFDDEMILSFLSFRNFKEEDHTRTFFQKINRLAPSHCLTIKDGLLKIERYASWDLKTQLKFENPADYVKEFKKIFDKAVRSRLRSRTTATAFLSGGHDSSAIVSSACSFLKETGSAVKLDALNLYSDDPLADERKYANQVAQAAGIPLHALFGKTRDFITGLGSFLHQVEAPMINVSRNLEPYQFLKNRGIRVILNGEGGDQVLDEFGFGADLLAHLRIPEYIRKSRSFCAEFNDNPMDFLHESLLQIIPEKILNLRRSIAGNVPARWLNQAFIREKNFKYRVLRAEAKPRFKSFSQEATYTQITRPYAIMKLELDERAWGMYGIEMRSPFFDSRLIQFMLSLPWEYRASGTRKLILKEAMKGVVPETVLSRRDKGNCTLETDTALRTLLERENPEVLCNRSGLMQKYADFKSVKKLADKYLAGQKDLRFELWFLITTDYMLQQFTEGVLNGREKEQEKEIQPAASH